MDLSLIVSFREYRLFDFLLSSIDCLSEVWNSVGSHLFDNLDQTLIIIYVNFSELKMYSYF